MNSAHLAEILAKLGVSDKDLAEAVELLQDRHEGKWYYDAEGLREAGAIGDLRSLTSVDSGVFRKLLGI